MGQRSNAPAYFAKDTAGIQTAAELAEKLFSIFAFLLNLSQSILCGLL